MLWRLPGGEAAATLDEAGEIATCAALLPDGRGAVTGGLDNELRVWDLAGKQCLRVLAGHQAAIHQLAIGPHGRQAVTASADQSARLWDLDTGGCLRVLEGHTGEVLCCAMSPDGRRAVTGGNDGSVVVWDLARGADLFGLEGHATAVVDLAWSGDGRNLLSAGQDGSLRLWEASGGKCLRTLDGAEPVTAAVLSPDGLYALAGSRDGAIHLWDIKARRRVRSFAGHRGAVTSVAFAPDGTRALSAGADGTLRVWHLDWQPHIRPFADWDQRARPHLELFLARHSIGGSRPQWQEQDFQQLLVELGRRGFGWLRPAGVKARLEAMAREGAQVPAQASRPRPEQRTTRPASPKRRQAQRVQKRLIATAVILTIPVAIFVKHQLSLRRLDLNSPQVAESRHDVMTAVVPTIPEIERQTRCAPDRLREYLDTFTGYSDDHWEWMAAKHCIEVLGDPAAVRPVLDMLRPRDQPTIGGGTVKRRDRGAAQDVLSVLVRMGDDSCSALGDALGDDDPVVRSVVATALAFRGSERSIGTLVDHADSSRSSVRIAVSQTLREIASSGQLDRDEAFALFRDMAGDEEVAVRRNVARALRVFKGSAAVKLGRTLTRDTDDEVAREATESIRMMR
jgi:hypothetical protein